MITTTQSANFKLTSQKLSFEEAAVKHERGKEGLVEEIRTTLKQRFAAINPGKHGLVSDDERLDRDAERGVKAFAKNFKKWGVFDRYRTWNETIELLKEYGLLEKGENPIEQLVALQGEGLHYRDVDSGYFHKFMQLVGRRDDDRQVSYKVRFQVLN